MPSAPVLAPTRVYGLLSEFDTPEALLAAARRARDHGFTHLQAYTPFPVEGISDVLDLPATRVPLFTLLGGILGGLTGFGMCCYANVISYRLNIGGRPFNSWPAWIPITFELTVLFGAIAAALSMLIANHLPRLHHPLFAAPRFILASYDRFFLLLPASDPRFHIESSRTFLNTLHPVSLTEVPDDSAS